MDVDKERTSSANFWKGKYRVFQKDLNDLNLVYFTY